MKINCSFIHATINTRILKRKIKNFILKTITGICSILFMLGLCVDIDYTESILSYVFLMLITGGWLILFCIANGGMKHD